MLCLYLLHHPEILGFACNLFTWMNFTVRQYIQSKIPGFFKRQRDSKMIDYESGTQSMKASMAIPKPLNPYHSSQSQQHGQKLTDIESRIVELY